MTDPVSYAERLIDGIIDRFSAIERRYLQSVGERIRKIGTASATDVYRLETLRDIGADILSLQFRLSDATNRSMAEICDIFLDASKRAQMPYVDFQILKPYADNSTAIAIAASQYAQTASRMQNLSNTTATERIYQKLVDEAITIVQVGTEDYQSAIRDSLRKAAIEGLRSDGLYRDENGTMRIQYASGTTRRLDSAIRQNVLDGTRQLFQRMTDDIGRQIGCDGVEITAHMDCAEDHLPYQGKQYTLEEFERLQDFLPRRIGQWNCRHFAYPIVLGASEPAYTDAQLAQFSDHSTEIITIEGRAKTRYQWTQEQRKLETAIRREKDCAIVAKAAGDDTLRRECQRKINAYRATYERISLEAGLDVRKDNMVVSGFRPVKVVLKKSIR